MDDPASIAQVPKGQLTVRNATETTAALAFK